MKRRNILKSLIAVPAALLLPAVFKLKSVRKKKSILLLNSQVAGFQHYQGEEIWHSLKAGDDLKLAREPKNLFDYDAVEIYRGSDKIGYLPRTHNSPVAQLMDRGMTLKSRIMKLSKSHIPGESVGIAVEMEV